MVPAGNNAFNAFHSLTIPQKQIIIITSSSTHHHYHHRLQSMMKQISTFTLSPFEWCYHGFYLPKFCGDKVFSYICREINLYGEVQIIWGSIFITTPSLCHFFRNSQHLEKRSVSFKTFFYWMHQELSLANTLKFTKKGLHKYLQFLCLMEKSVLFAAYFKLLLQ